MGCHVGEGDEPARPLEDGTDLAGFHFGSAPADDDLAREPSRGGGLLVCGPAAPRGYVGDRLNSWAPVLLQVYCSSWTPLAVDAPGVSMHRPELSATKL